MAKLPEEVMEAIFNEGYAKGKADACKEMRKTITTIAQAFINALDAEIDEIDKKQ